MQIRYVSRVFWLAFLLFLWRTIAHGQGGEGAQQAGAGPETEGAEEAQKEKEDVVEAEFEDEEKEKKE